MIIEYWLKYERNALLLIEPFSNNKKIYLINKTNNEGNNVNYISIF